MNPTLFQQWAKQFASRGGVTKSNVGLGNVDNTSDANKPVSTAQQTAIDAKVADAINNGTTTIAPSQNAVFDALALKQDADAQLTSLAALAYAGNSAKVIAVNVGETDFELVTPSGGSGLSQAQVLARMSIGF